MTVERIVLSEEDIADDWVKAVGWGFPDIRTYDEFIGMVGDDEESIGFFVQLPAWNRAPVAIKEGVARHYPELVDLFFSIRSSVGMEKHLQGQHDQSAHRPPSYRAGGQDEAAGDKPAVREVIHTSDIDEALRLLSEGRAVELDTTEKVFTLIDKLHAWAVEAKKKGDKAPNIDLCSVSVKGTNLFCAESLGIPRIQMPQLSGMPVEGSVADTLPKNEQGEVNVGKLFTERLSEMGVSVTRTEVPAARLRASQNELKGSNVAFMMSEEGQKAVKLHSDTIFVSRDGYVIDGHHRWAALVGLDSSDGQLGDVPIQVLQIDLPISQVLPLANQFSADIGVAPKAAKRRVPLGVRYVAG